MKYQMILQSQQDFFRSGATLSISYRREVLSLLEGAILNRREQIESALAEDLGKSRQEAYSTEIAVVLSELRYARRHLKSWARSKAAVTPLPAIGRADSGLHLSPTGRYSDPGPMELSVSALPFSADQRAGSRELCSSQALLAGGQDGPGYLRAAGGTFFSRVRCGLPGGGGNRRSPYCAAF